MQVKSKYDKYLDDEDIKDMKNRILLLINHKEFKKLLESSVYFKEQELIFNDEVKIIDLLIKKSDEFIVID